MLVGWLVGRSVGLPCLGMDGWSSVSCWAERGKRGTRAGAGERDKATMTAAAASSIHHTSATSLTVPLRPRAREGGGQAARGAASGSELLPPRDHQTCQTTESRHGSRRIFKWFVM